MVIRNAYDSLYESFEFGQKNWFTYVKEMLNEMEMIEIWNKQSITHLGIKAIICKLQLNLYLSLSVFKVSYFMANKEFQKNKHENLIMKTLNDICNTDKYPNLCTYKTRLENYLLTLENNGHKIALTMFRKSSHNLHIETGHYERLKLESHQRLCLL